MKEVIDKHSNLTFDEFSKLAKDSDKSKFEKIGFPDKFRDGKETDIFFDINSKVKVSENETIVDIGAGCSELPEIIATYCDQNYCNYIVIDSKEMLANIPDNFHSLKKMPGKYPDMSEFFSKYKESVDVILCYSVFQYIFSEGNSWKFLDKTLSLLNSGGRFLIGDIPNINMRKRFLESKTGIDFHKSYMKTNDNPKVIYNQIERDEIDDSVVFSILQRARAQGFHAYILPQLSLLPMSNRREDILIIKP